MSGGSQQLRQYRIARRAGQSLEAASALSGIGLTEAKMTDADDARFPPPVDAFIPLGAWHCAACALVLCTCPDYAWMGMAA